MYQLNDIFVGSFAITQNFGDRPEVYQARFGIKSHNGTDFACPLLTPILAAADGYVSEKGFDQAGYGNYLKVVHNGYLTLYAHLNDIQVGKGQRVIAGQLLGHSGNTGLSTGAHLHFGIAPCDTNGIKTESNNGWSGYIDPRGNRVQWVIKNVTAPVTPAAQDKPPVMVKFDEYPHIIAEGSNWIAIGNFLVNNGINEYLQANNEGILDMQNNKSDPKGGEKAVNYMAYLLDKIRDLESRKPQDMQLTEIQKQGLFEGLKKAVHDFIYVRN